LASLHGHSLQIVGRRKSVHVRNAPKAAVGRQASSVAAGHQEPTLRQCSKWGGGVLFFDDLVGEREQGGGFSRSSTLAVLSLMASFNLVGCRTGRSDGLSPLRIRPA